MIDPMDFQTIHALEDALDVVCFCGVRDRFDPYCPIHGDHRPMVEAITGMQERIETAEGESEKKDEDLEELRDGVKEADERAEKAEREASQLGGRVDDLTYAIEQALTVLSHPTLEAEFSADALRGRIVAALGLLREPLEEQAAREAKEKAEKEAAKKPTKRGSRGYERRV